MGDGNILVEALWERTFPECFAPVYTYGLMSDKIRVLLEVYWNQQRMNYSLVSRDINVLGMDNNLYV